MKRWAVLLGLGQGMMGCHESGPPCDPPSNFGCEDAEQCEEVQGREEPQCVTPVVLRGKVRDAATDAAVVGARVTAYDQGGVAEAAAATTGTDGSYAIRLHAPRDQALAPQSRKVQVRAWAPGYGPFPQAWQTWPAVDVASAREVTTGVELVLSSTDTDVALLAFTGGPGNGTACGTVAVQADAVAPLVVAEYDGDPARATAVSGFTDRDGSFELYGLPPGAVRLRAYAKGRSYAQRSFDLAAGERTCRDLPVDAAPTARVSGAIERPAGSAATPAVTLVVAATWDPALGDGDAPPGLSVPAKADGSYVLEGVPAGRYRVVASYDDDDLVALGNPPTIDVAAQDATVSEKVPVAAALAVVAPGADGPQGVSGPPTLTWRDHASEAGYRVTVTNAFGATVFQRNEPMHSGDAPAVPFQGALVKGMQYRFRAEALDAGGRTIARTEDLRGIFYYLP